MTIQDIEDIDAYGGLAMRTAGKFVNTEEQLKCAALGLAGEAGELANKIKKTFYHEHPLDTDDLVLELGDCLWYIALAAAALDVPLSEIAERNILKLARRYPEGFSPERSLHRE
jgi:NTP pyrophosphatase (non-canonical NTP hydrolase)